MIRAYVRPVLTALLSVALLSSCADKGSPTTDPPTADNPNTIKVGVVLSLSGPLATGDDAKRGAEVAVAQINALGGVLGKQLELEAVDDQSDEKIARAKFDELLAKDGVYARLYRFQFAVEQMETITTAQPPRASAPAGAAE